MYINRVGRLAKSGDINAWILILDLGQHGDILRANWGMAHNISCPTTPTHTINSLLSLGKKSFGFGLDETVSVHTATVLIQAATILIQSTSILIQAATILVESTSVLIQAASVALSHGRTAKKRDNQCQEGKNLHHLHKNKNTIAWKTSSIPSISCWISSPIRRLLQWEAYYANPRTVTKVEIMDNAGHTPYLSWWISSLCDHSHIPRDTLPSVHQIQSCPGWQIHIRAVGDMSAWCNQCTTPNALLGAGMPHK